jgi:hypothetical protein
VSFATDFRSLVVPRLRHACRLAALRIATDGASFAAEEAAITAEAYRLGAGRLDAGLGADLEEAIGDWLLADLGAALTAWEAAEAIAAQVAAGIARFEDEVRKAIE